MRKYGSMLVHKTTTSSRDWVCAKCKRTIPAGEEHVREALTDKRINFIGKRFHKNCERAITRRSKRLEDFE